MITSKRLFISAVVVTFLVCGNFARAQGWSDSVEDSSEDAKTPPPDLAGHWVGSVDDSSFGVADATMDITQVKNKIGGTWDIVGFASGTIADGSVNGNKGTLKFKFKLNKTCAPNATATLSNGNMTMTGKYFKKTRHCHASGTFTASLQ